VGRLISLTTEEVNPLSIDIDQCDTAEIVARINEQDKLVAEAVSKELEQISKAVDSIYDRMKQGGKLYYIGAGTSGRLGVLDASECPPTFSSDPEMIQGYIAGGDRALRDAVEGAEDDENAGSELIMEKQISSKDIVIGITASGGAPYVLGAVKQAMKMGALTIALVNNKSTKLSEFCDITIAPIVGPEIISGSTRMKSGTAQKMVLNIISTAVMIKLGKVYGNLMVDLKASNIKLYQRSIRMIRSTTGISDKEAAHHLKEADGQVKLAIMMIKSGLPKIQAENLLKQKDGHLKAALEAIEKE
jgi:N-acetylmuramic acid 6-phosphate etherase